MGTRGEKMSFGGGDCVFRRWEPWGKADVDLRRVAIEVSPLRLPLLPGDPLPPGAELGKGNQDFNHISIHIPGRMQPSPGPE